VSEGAPYLPWLADVGAHWSRIHRLATALSRKTVMEGTGDELEQS